MGVSKEALGSTSEAPRSNFIELVTLEIKPRLKPNCVADEEVEPPVGGFVSLSVDA